MDRKERRLKTCGYRNFVSILLVGAAVLHAGCGTVDSQPAPSPPSMVPFAADPFTPVGIRPDPDAANAESSESGAIIVEWRALDESNLRGVRLGGYNLYRSDTADAEGHPVNFRRIVQINLSQAQNDTTFADSAVRLNVRYSYYVTSFSRADNTLESGPSDTVRYTLLPRPVPSYPLGSVELPADGGIDLRFGPPEAAGLVAVQVYAVRPENERIVDSTMWQWIGVVGFGSPSVKYAGLPLVRGNRYRWRVDKILEGVPLGNASRWATFTAQ